MRRITEQQMLVWRDSKRRKPLIIRGARQVGKTWMVENFLAASFENLAKVDLEERTDLHAHFSGNLDPKGILEALEITTGRITPGETLLFLDEIQACPRAIMALRYFYEKMPELHVVAAGSLLEFAFDEISFPVGRVQYLHMHPMSFYEYLLALGNEPMAELTRRPQAHVSESSQRMVLAELKKYLLVGGMPESVKVYRDSGSLLDSFAVQTEILESFRDDFAKYKPHMDTDCLNSVFQSVARTVGKQIKYVHLNDGHTGPTNRKAFDLLCKARVLHKIPACSPSGLPLAATAKEKKFKACFLDVGLMHRLCGVAADAALAQDNLLAIYNGQLAEQFVAQEMLTWQESGVYYWAREAKSSSAEVDYLAVREGAIYPVEVKSGTGGRMRSLHLLLKSYPNCPYGVVLYSGCFHELPEQKLTFLPLYCAATIGDAQAGKDIGDM